MEVEINAIASINESMQKVYYTLMDDEGNIYRCDVNTPVLEGSELQDYLNRTIEILYATIIRRKYNGFIPISEGNTLLEKVKNWIADGHKDYRGNTVLEVPFEDTHRGSNIPPEVVDRSKIVGSTRLLLENATTLEELKQALIEILLGK